MAKLEFSKKKFIISAAADGIGLVIAKKIVENGGIVYISDIDEIKINKIKSNKKYKNKIFAEKINCSKPEQVKKYFDSLKSVKKFDGLVNNIGIAGPTKYIQDISIDEWKNTIDVNINSHFYFSKYAIPFLKRNKGGAIINLSSTAGIFGFPQRTPYAVSKWGIVGLTKTLAMELGKNKIRVNGICPGSVEGDRMRRVINAKANLLKEKPTKIKKELETMVSLKSFVSHTDIASIALYLLSEKSKNISGQIIAVDGNTERMI
tara:strand:- start:1505 stop:2290 length:786 start_codon:yes stop_codon:yes gene_type:complete